MPARAAVQREPLFSWSGAVLRWHLGIDLSPVAMMKLHLRLDLIRRDGQIVVLGRNQALKMLLAKQTEPPKKGGNYAGGKQLKPVTR